MNGPAKASVPVEYGVAVDRFLAAAHISEASRRVYRVALETWGWLLVDKAPPSGPARRGAKTPTLLLGRIDGAASTDLIRRALTSRALMVDSRTFARESSILRNAAHWWAAQGWIAADAETAVKTYSATTMRPAAVAAPVPAAATLVEPLPPTSRSGPVIDVVVLFALPVPLREQALWRLVYESGAPIGRLLALDASDLDFTRRRVRPRTGPRQADRIGWGPLTADLLPLLTIGRTAGPVFRTTRRAPARVAAADRCPYTGHARLSARRAAELFEAATHELDPQGRGWNLRDLRIAGRQAGGHTR